MRSAVVTAVSLSLLTIATGTARADTSLACLYMLMRVYHAELDTCHVALSADQEERYSRMRIGMEKFIHDNARNDPKKIISGIENNNIRRALQNLKSCQSNDIRSARKTMNEITTPEHQALIENTLSVPRDPVQGDCSG
jgi:hypothetical protein